MAPKQFYLVISSLIILVVLAGCSGGPDGSARKVFEDLHSASVYYVVQDEEATTLGQNDAGNTIVQVCYQIRRDLGSPFQAECGYLTMLDNNGTWEAVLMYDGDQNCWTTMGAGKEVLASTEWLDRTSEALAASECS